MARWISLLLILTVVPIAAYTQNRYLAYLRDKENNSFSLENPDEFLSQRALERRSKGGILLDNTDLPVSSSYIQSLEEDGFKVQYSSKWLNAVLLEIQAEDSVRLTSKEFVVRLERVADGEKLNTGSRNNRKPEALSRSNPQMNPAYEWHGIDRLHENRKRGEGIRIAVMDASFRNVNAIPQFAHLFAEDRIIMTENIVAGSADVFSGPTDHGTRVLSVIAGMQDGLFGGIAPGSEYLLFETEDASSEYRIEEFNWIVAAEKADSAGADVINTSLGYSYGFTDPDMDYRYEDMDGRTTMISIGASKAVATGIVVVVSAGNEGNSSWNYITAPADVDGVLAVGALDTDSTLAGFSSRGPAADGRVKPDVVSLGVGVPSVNNEGNVQFPSGTSFSSPVIAGYAALLIQQYPTLTGKEITELIRSSGNQATFPDNNLGYGIPFLEIILSNEPRLENNDIRIYPVPASSDLYWVSARPVEEVAILDLHGRLIIKRNGLRNSIDVSKLKPGMYIIQLAQNGSIRQFRFIKQ